MKRILLLTVLIAMAMAPVWAGTATGEATSTGPIEIELMRGTGNALIPEPEDDYILQGLNDALNIDLTLTAIQSEYSRQLNVRIAGGNFPDVFDSGGRNFFLQFARDGVLLDLTPHENKLPNYLSMNPGAAPLGIVDGRRYSTATNLGINYNGFYIRKDWLDKLGLDVPETLDDYLEAAKAFTFNDPDGNGKNDTYGYGGVGIGGFTAFFAAFGIGNPGTVFVEDGKVVFSEQDPRMKDAIAWIKKFVEAGVVDPNIMTVKKGLELTQKQSQGLVGLVWSSWPGMRKPEFEKQLVAVQPDADWILLDAPKGPTGYQNNGVFGTLGARIYYAFPSTADDNPVVRDKAIELVDYAASEPGYRLTSFGLEDTHYTVQGDGSLKAEQRLFDDGGYFWIYQFGGRKEVEYLMLKFAYAASEIEQNGNAQKIERLNGGIDIPDGYNHADANRYMEEEALKFVYGTRDLSEFNDFVNTLNTTFSYETYKKTAVEQLKALGIAD